MCTAVAEMCKNHSPETKRDRKHCLILKHVSTTRKRCLVTLTHHTQGCFKRWRQQVFEIVAWNADSELLNKESNVPVDPVWFQWTQTQIHVRLKTNPSIPACCWLLMNDQLITNQAFTSDTISSIIPEQKCLNININRPWVRWIILGASTFFGVAQRILKSFKCWAKMRRTMPQIL